MDKLIKSAFHFVCIAFYMHLISTCTHNAKDSGLTDFETETGLNEDEFYSFLNDVIALRQDSIYHARILFAYAGNPIKIEFENDAPTTLEPPGINILKATYQLDSNRLSGFKLIQPTIYKRVKDSVTQNSCNAFSNTIGNHMLFIYLPWYNPKDSSALIKVVDYECPPHYHQGQGVQYRFKILDHKWKLVN